MVFASGHFLTGEQQTMDLRPGLANARCPVLAIGAELDPVCPIEADREVAGSLPDELVRFERVAGVSHAEVEVDSADLGPHISVLDVCRQRMYVDGMDHTMSEKGSLLLTALGAGASHGYALAQRVSEITDGEVTLAAGTLYATLDRLLADGLIEEAGEEIVDGRARRNYRITQNGRVQLAERAEHLDRVVDAMHAALRPA